MSLFKSLSRHPVFVSSLCRLGAAYIALVRRTSRWKIIDAEIPNDYWDKNRPFILAFWHGRLLMIPGLWRKGKVIRMLISQHRDGRYIAETVSHFGIDTIAGSTTKGGAAAMRAMLKTLKENNYVGITPDGPQGPRMRASIGIVNLARLSGVPVIPVAYAVKSSKILNTWDHFLLPRPFTRGVAIWGEPIIVPKDDDEASSDLYRQKIEDALNSISAQADLAVGRNPIQPAAEKSLTAKAGKRLDRK